MTLAPETQQFWNGILALNAPLIYTLTPEDARASLLTVQNADVPKPDAEIEDTAFPVGPGGSVSIRIVKPKGAHAPLPVALYLHGGGWILGDKDTHDRLVRELATRANIAIVFLNYALSPEAHFPIANEQAYATARYLAERGAAHGLDGTRLAVAGDSAGANMTAALMLMAKERGGPDIAFQLMLYPATDASMEMPSYREFADGPWLTANAMKWFWDAYLPDAQARMQALVSPLHASLDQLQGQPPAMLITTENDVLRDEGEAYAAKLAAAGVRVAATRYGGTMHDFMMLNDLRHTPAAEAGLAQAANGLKSALWSKDSAKN